MLDVSGTIVFFFAVLLLELTAVLADIGLCRREDYELVQVYLYDTTYIVIIVVHNNNF